MAGPREVELKLEVTSAVAARLRNGGPGKLAAGASVRQHLVSVYFDTANRALRKKGLTLRVRSDGERRIQTVKGSDGPSAGLFDRREWESEIVGEGPDLEAAERTPAGDVLNGGKHPKPIAPVFETIVDRTTWQIERNGSAIEVALDEGRVQSDGSARAFAELELELKHGSPAELFAFTRDLGGAQVPQLGVLTKSERGYALASGEKRTSFKAEPIALRPGTSAGEAFRVVAHGCIRQFRLNEPLLVETRAPDSLHQARVAIRRLRSALSVFKPIVADDDYPRFKRRLKAVSRQFGAARNIDVYLARIAEAGAAESDRLLTATPDVMERLAAERARAYDRVITTIGRKGFRHLLLDLAGWLEAGAWRNPSNEAAVARCDEPLADFAARVLKKRRRKVKRTGRHLAELSPPARHRVRISAKKLRYASEFFAVLAKGKKRRKRQKAFVGALEDLQTALGDLNDLASGHELAAKLALNGGASSGPAAADPAAEEERTARLLAAAAEAHREMAAIEPFWS